MVIDHTPPNVPAQLATLADALIRFQEVQQVVDACVLAVRSISPGALCLAAAPAILDASGWCVATHGAWSGPEFQTRFRSGLTTWRDFGGTPTFPGGLLEAYAPAPGQPSASPGLWSLGFSASASDAPGTSDPAGPSGDEEGIGLVRELLADAAPDWQVDVFGGVRPSPGLLAVAWERRLDAAAASAEWPPVIAGLMRLAVDRINTAQSAAAAQAAHRNASGFLSVMAHDLRTPLTSIRGFAQLLLRQIGPQKDGSLGAGLTTIMEQSDRLSGMTELLLDVARIQTGSLALRRTALDMGQLTREVVDLLGALPGPLPILLEAPEEPLVVDADRSRITQAIRAFVLYAGQRHRARQVKAPMRLAVKRERNGVRVQVTDEGDILDREAQRQLYYLLVNRAPAGPGLMLAHVDLYMARGAFEAHGGSVAVESPVPSSSSGACVSGWLPLVAVAGHQ